MHQVAAGALWCETVAVFAFGAAWVAKSDALFRAAQPSDEPGADRDRGTVSPAPS
ncbi:hypothetical protein [Micromonospora sp. CA-244673]|uniref:hypothetical protein n=1 Tax=Micromonospora sp. CA-244673 TaxID=3239958 RepID=UPI003D8AA531